jgi:hypothetical protein
MDHLLDLSVLAQALSLDARQDPARCASCDGCQSMTSEVKKGADLRLEFDVGGNGVAVPQFVR